MFIKNVVFHFNSSRLNSQIEGILSRVLRMSGTKVPHTRIKKPQAGIRTHPHSKYAQSKLKSSETASTETNDEEESWMAKTEKVLNAGMKPIDAAQKLQLEQKYAAMSSNASVGDNPEVKIIPIPEYKGMIEDLTRLREINVAHTNQIKELELETRKVLGEFGGLYEENAKLRNKLDTGGEPFAESYRRIFDDRKTLREAEAGYKKRIIRFEQEVVDAKKKIAKLEHDIQATKTRLEKYKKITSKDKVLDALNKQIKDLKDENKGLKAELKLLVQAATRAPRKQNSVSLAESKPGTKTRRKFLDQGKAKIDCKKESHISKTKHGDSKEVDTEVNRYHDHGYYFDYRNGLPDTDINHW
ncbi:uncharacterized protein LOC128222306 isoform X1 [Mya arenaria]|uniref:uncharacterized protein LOC128222306 isoform X1 n=1 Tax=Mya arenaria TaxID=6604 RepID=UPI0022E6375F|nr:uncharacterized protein LOC128222306 isoform X1 [Mya arenaria]